MFKDIQKKYLLLILLPLILFIFVPMTFSKYSKSINQQIGLNISDPTYTVVFNANGGTGTMADQTFSYKTSQSLRANDFTNGDLVFLEWNTQANGSGESYYNQQTVDRLSGINGDTVTLYAQWGSKVAKIGNTYYDTLQEAVDDVPNTDVETIVILLQNTSETITVDEGQNIVFDFRNNTLSNKGNTAVITNDGTISISNGTILSSAASNGAINNNSKGTITISGGSVIVTGGRQALYNNKWIATNNGLYYSSADGSEVFNHFTPSNSDIPSNVVYSVECDTINDRIYSVTDNGFAEYVPEGDAAALNFDNVYAFPDPVEPDFTGMVKIANLMDNSYVTVTDRNGTVVAQFGPVMGSALWDGSGADGERVPTGVYNIYAAQGSYPVTTGTPHATVKIIK